MNDVAIIVNSCKSFYETTVPLLIDSAKNAKVPLENIYIVVGESETTSDIIKMYGYNIVFCKYINIDYNGVIYFTQTETGLKELKKYKYFFHMHDTCDFLPYFWPLINNLKEKCSQYIKSKQVYTQNIGLINTEWFIQNKSEFFKDIINFNPELKMDYKLSNYPNKLELYEKYGEYNLPPHMGEDSLFEIRNNQSFGTSIDPIIIEYRTNKYGSERCANVYVWFGIIKYSRWSLHLKDQTYDFGL
jgi:hypothetical protein